MNCQEYKSMIEDALDVSLQGELKASVLRHLEHCPDCRGYYARRQQEHSDLFMSINAAYAHSRLPPAGFADRVIREVVARRTARRGWWRFSLKRWAMIAALAAVMAGFVFAAAVVVSLSGDEVVVEEGVRGANGAESTDLEEGAVVYSVPEVPLVSYATFAISPQSSDSQLEINQKGKQEMGKAKAAAAALTAAMATASLTAAREDGYEYIISGDPVAAETNGSSSASSATASLTSGTLAGGFVLASELEARYRTAGESAVTALRSDKFNAAIIIVR